MFCSFAIDFKTLFQVGESAYHMSTYQRRELWKQYQISPNITRAQAMEIAESLQLHVGTVIIWFASRQMSRENKGILRLTQTHDNAVLQIKVPSEEMS